MVYSTMNHPPPDRTTLERTISDRDGSTRSAADLRRRYGDRSADCALADQVALATTATGCRGGRSSTLGLTALVVRSRGRKHVRGRRSPAGPVSAAQANFRR